MNEYIDDAEIVESSNPRAGLLFLAAIIGFFAFLAIIVPIIKANGGSTDMLFFAVIGAVLGAILVPVLLNALLSKLHLKGKSRREILESLVGYTPMYPFDEQETMMLPSTVVGSFYEAIPDDRAMVPYEGEEDEEDEDEQDTAIIESNPMHLASDFQPNIDSFLSDKVTIIGITGAGKSNAVAVICEELGEYGVSFCLADTKDEYSPLADQRYLPRGILAGNIDLLRTNPDLQRQHFMPVDMQGAYLFGQTILEEGLQVVLNLKSYPYDEAASIMVEIIRGMNAWQDARPNKDRVSCMFILEEAHRWLPQRSDESQLSPDVLKALQFTMFDTMVRVGRSNGLGLIMATQKVTEVDKRALQSQWRFLFRQTESRDLAYYKALGIDVNEVPTLRTGECYVFSPSLQGWPIMMRLSHSPHGAHTPGLASVLAHRKQLRPLSSLTTRSFAGQRTAMLDPDTGDLPVPAVLPEQQATFTVPVTPAPKAMSLQEYAAIWNGGANSVRLLQDAAGIETYYKANQMYHRLLKARLIEVNR